MQEKNQYAIYQRSGDNRFVKSFSIDGNGAIVTHTDENLLNGELSVVVV